MKTAIKTLDIISTIWIGITIIGLIVYICIYPAIAELIEQYVETNLPEKVLEWFDPSKMGRQIASTIYEILKDGAALTIAIIGTVQVYKGDKTRTPHIFLIVGSAVAGCPFGVVGGILGLVDLHNEEKNQVIIEEPKEEQVVEVEDKDRY